MNLTRHEALFEIKTKNGSHNVAVDEMVTGTDFSTKNSFAARCRRGSVYTSMPGATGLKAFFLLGVLIGGGWLSVPALAQFSFVEHLSGFDAARVERAGLWVRQPNDPAAVKEAAKLVFQLRRVDERTVKFASDGSPVKPGAAVRLRGTATDVAALPLPSELADLLEMPRLYRVTVNVDGSDRYVMTERVPRRWLESDSRKGQPAQGGSPGWSAAVEAVACAVDSEGQPVVLAASAMQWYPTSEESDAVGVALLARNGFDAGLLDKIAALQQRPLQSDEQEAFYGMLAAAGKLEHAQVPAPEPTGTVELLRRSQELAGHWIRVPVRTVRITRIAVTESHLLERLGQDHYWQIDTMGSLGDVAVTIEVEGEGGRSAGNKPQATFSNRFPVSVAALRLPDALAERIERESGAGAVVTMLRQPIVVDGFFYRLWSYDSEFMQNTTGREQFGPLLMASRIRVPPPVQRDPLGAAMIGWAAAGIFLIGVAIVIVYLIWTARRDDEAVRRRRAREANDVQFPPA